MSKPVAGAGESRTGENPHVTSKFDRSHGRPREPGHVSAPGGTAEPKAEPAVKHERHAPSEVHHKEHGKVHTYHHDHPAMAGQHHGARAKHPFNDAAQEAYEHEGYGGGRGK